MHKNGVGLISKKMEVSKYIHDILGTNPVILDTETTGLGYDAKIVEISVIDSDGSVLLDSLVNPCHPIPAEATAIHGITTNDVQSAPMWGDIQDKLHDVLKGRRVLIYNSEFDVRLINRSIARGKANPALIAHLASNSVCVMKAFAAFNGEWNSYRNEYRWIKLTDALKLLNIIPKGKAHRALSDCQATLAVAKGMSSAYEYKIEKDLVSVEFTAPAIELPKHSSTDKISISAKLLSSPLVVFILAIAILVIIAAMV